MRKRLVFCWNRFFHHKFNLYSITNRKHLLLETFFESTYGGYQGLNWLATTNSENWERRFTVNSSYQNSFSLHNDQSYNLLPQESSSPENEFGSLAHARPNFEFSVNYHLHVNRPEVNSSTALLKHQEISSTDIRNNSDSKKHLEELFTQKCLERSVRDSPERVISVRPLNFCDQNHQMISNSCRFSPLLTPSPLSSANSSYSSQQQLQSHDQHKFYDETVEFVQRDRRVGQFRSKKG